MKSNKWLILILLIFCRCANDKMTIKENAFNLSISPGACFPEVSDKYVYPIVPGMIEWQQIKSTDEAYKLCQLPDSVLKSISTPGLIDALIHAPMFTDFYNLSDASSALKWFGHYEQFNCAKELFQRKDAGDALVTYFKLVCFDCVSPPFGYYGDFERIIGLQCLFAKKEILDKMGHEKKKEAVSELLANYEQYSENWDSIVVMLHIMYEDEYDPLVKYFKENEDKYQHIIKEGNLFLSDPIDLFVLFAKSFINEKN